MTRCARSIAALALLSLLAGSVQASFVGRPEVEQFIDEVAARHALDRGELQAFLREAKLQQSVLDAISRPAERKPWHAYRPIFVTRQRIDLGLEFWQQHQSLLARLERETGVAAEILVAIVGVETRYGEYRGRYRALDSLATLAFNYPPRGKFFRRELEQFFLLVRDESLDAKQVYGSYAAAMGVPQFISSSYREYAIDYDGDGQRDLWNSPADVLGSVANYFRRHGWRSGESVTFAAAPADDRYRELLSPDLKPRISARQLQEAGLVDGRFTAPGPFSVMELRGSDGREVWVGHHNFYVITRYNHSALYAMAVFQLATEMARRRAQ